MNQQFDLSREAILRLPVYFRYLREWMVQGKEKISSEEFASVMGVTSSQVRRDMSCFGISGQKGYGYTCRHLHDTIADVYKRQAKELILSGKYPLKKISEMVGIDEYNHFLKMFKYHEGVSPNKYRQVFINTHFNKE